MGELEKKGASAWAQDALKESRESRREHQSGLASTRQRWVDRNKYYYDGIRRLLKFIIEPNRRVLNVRSQTGHLLEAVEPSYGVGTEISQKLVDVAKEKYAQFTFLCTDPEDLEIKETFDYILFNDISDTVDVLAAFKRLVPLCERHTRLLIYGYNRLWQPILEIAHRLGLRMRPLEPNWLSEADVRGLLRLAGFEPLQTYQVMLFPKWIPLISEFCNRILARLPIISKLCMASVIVARPAPKPILETNVGVSVIIPCRNEFGNVEAAVKRIPDMGKHTEIIFCDDKSTDGTGDEVQRLQACYPEKDIKLISGPGICKAENVWTGFRAAGEDILMILDGDLTVMPEELPYFFKALIEDKGEFINGSRLVYPLQKGAMKLANTLGNKGFSLLFSYLLDHQIKDTLCGTKVLWRSDWERIENHLGSWGVQDRWGDYELLFGATKLNLEIIDLPVHYMERVYGVTKMTSVFKQGLNMLRMCIAAGLKLKGGY